MRPTAVARLVIMNNGEICEDICWIDTCICGHEVYECECENGEAWKDREEEITKYIKIDEIKEKYGPNAKLMLLLEKY